MAPFILIVSAAGAFGERALRPWKPRFEPIHYFLYFMGIGFGILGVGTFFVGYVGFLSKGTIFLLVGGPAAFGWGQMVLQRHSIFSHLKWKELRRPPNYFFIIPALCVSLYFVASFAPPVAWDVQMYHLAMPKIYLQTGAMRFIPFMCSSEMPQLMEMIYTLCLGMGSPALAQVLHWTMGALIGLLTFHIAARDQSVEVGWVAVSLLVTTTVFKILSVTAKIDLGLGLFCLLAVDSLLRYQKTGWTGWLWFMGIFSGLAASTKLMGFAWFGVLLGCLLWTQALSKGVRWTHCVIPLVPFGLLVSPWLLRSLWETGNPIWPFCYKWFGGVYWDGAQSDLLSKFASEYQSSGHWLKDVLAKGRELFSFQGSNFIPGKIFVLFFISSLALFYVRPFKRSMPLSLLWGYAMGCLGVYLCIMPRSVRYLIPIFPLMAIFIATALNELKQKTKKGRWFAGAIVIVVLAHQCPLFDGHLWKKVAFLWESSSEETYLEKSSDNYRALQWINTNTPLTSKILFLNDVRGFYLDREYIWGDALNQKFVNYDRVRNLSDLLTLWHRHGVTHIFMSGSALFWPTQGQNPLNEFLSQNRPLTTLNGYRVFALDPAPQTGAGGANSGRDQRVGS